MTAPNLTYLVAGQYMNELLREAESVREVQEAGHSRRGWRPSARRFVRRATSVIDLDIAAIAAQKP